MPGLVGPIDTKITIGNQLICTSTVDETIGERVRVLAFLVRLRDYFAA